MTETQSASAQALDPKRPWLTDERELPRHMNWVQTLLNPAGESPRLHFTRAWTMLFFVQLMVLVLPGTLALVLDVAGGSGAPIQTFGLYAVPVVFAATTLMSYVAHARRLNDARKPAVLAIIVLIPLAISIALVVMSAGGAASQYDERFQARQDYLSDPDSYRLRQREQAEAARQEREQAASESGEESGEAQSQRQRRGPPGGGQRSDPSVELPPKPEFVLKRALPAMTLPMIVLSGLVAIWSLLWVARVPFFGTYPGEDGFRERRPYEA